MSTRSGIGIKENGKVKGIYCHYDGYIGGNGLRLLDSCNDKSKLEKIINMGNIRSLGTNLYPPKISFPDRQAYEDCWRVTTHYKTSFCDFYGGREEKAITFKSDYDFRSGIDGEYFYLFDTSKTKWYVIEDDYKTKEIKYFDLDKLIKDHDYFVDFYLYHNRFWIDFDEENNGKQSKSDYIRYAENEWKEMQEKIKKINKQKNDSIVDICNHWVHEVYFSDKPDMSDIEFGTSETKELGKHYVIFSALKNGETKRKVLKRSKNINDLTLAVCNQYGISPYKRPFFDNK